MSCHSLESCAFQRCWKVNAHEIKSGMIYRDAKVTVTAFPTKHALESYGYRFDTPDRSIVISGDTSPTDETINACNRCDVLIHEARAVEMFARLPEERRAFGAKNHTTSELLAALATRPDRACSSSITPGSPGGQMPKPQGTSPPR